MRVGFLSVKFKKSDPTGSKPEKAHGHVARRIEIVDRGSKATLPLTIPRHVFKSSAKDSTHRLVRIELQGDPHSSSVAGAAPTTGARGASSPNFDLEAFSHNPVHGRADIEGSKSNVAMNAWLPQASYPCGSIGYAFTVRSHTRNQNQTSFYPFVPHEISVLVELILGHLRYLLIDVPPQPNSSPDNVFCPDRLAEAGLGSKRRDDEAFGYLKRVIVTPAVYPHLVEFLHFDIQSTGQKSHYLNIHRDHRNALF
ncbi:uncharacterized protein LOC111310713 [Durio zibethinus]|uniref:Uncharacterized protein LOC111310713 n=1 Tax=Durio zibethinus TaxID=66656 RepID=A0A6P6AM10_DURZI|nr:uncharacterized protein LOC111310713 [Durio zibethinus]